jgi:glutamate synthase domain-containing protein 2
MKGYFIIISLVLLALSTYLTLQNPWWAILFIFVLPLVILGVFDALQKGNNVWRNYPWVGHIKQVLVDNRELLQDWMIENDREGRPFNWIEKNIVYKRAMDGMQELPFGTQFDYYKTGFEWFLHSTAPIAIDEKADVRITVGGPDCKQPYSCSILNVSAMSFGSISANATLALNAGAKLGNFASNTGEGGLTKYHTQNGGDLIFQFGTAYFGCRAADGGFDEQKFATVAAHPQVKMIEMKISQGAKPGYGAILPGSKATEEIAEIRGIKPYETVVSPPGHATYKTPVELLQFVKKLRDLSNGKPVGFKFCIGQPYEFLAICKAMVKTGIKPDFITIDGGEGGTGAAPFDSINWVGMPLIEALVYAYDALVGFNLKKDIKLFASGKAISGFQVARLIALGADAVNSARGMMLALGCVQALQCNENTCPTGVTTMNPKLTRGLVPEDKKVKIYNFHHNTITAVKEILAAAGMKHTSELSRKSICRRISGHGVQTLDQIYPYLQTGVLLTENYPEQWRKDMAVANADSFRTNVWSAVEYQDGQLSSKIRSYTV